MQKKAILTMIASHICLCLRIDPQGHNSLLLSQGRDELRRDANIILQFLWRRRQLVA